MADFVEGDTGSKFVHTCKDDDTDSPINLTGSTVLLRWKNAAGTIVEKTMTITDAANGVVEYQFLANELFSPQMTFEVKITNSSSNVLHSLELLRESVRGPL